VVEVGEVVVVRKLLKQQVGQRGCTLAHREAWMRTTLDEGHLFPGFRQNLREERTAKARPDD
jgi:hypothetical protein